MENIVHAGSKTSSPLPRGLAKLSLLTTGEVLTYSLAGFQRMLWSFMGLNVKTETAD